MIGAFIMDVDGVIVGKQQDKFLQSYICNERATKEHCLLVKSMADYRLEMWLVFIGIFNACVIF